MGFLSTFVRGQTCMSALPRVWRREADTTSCVADYLTRSVRRASGFVLDSHQGTSPQITDERWTYDKKCGVSLSYVPFPRSLLPFGVVKEGEQLGIDLVFQGRAHAVRPAGNDLELGAFHKLGGR